MRVLFIGLGSIAGRHIKNLNILVGKDLSVTVFRSISSRPVPDDIAPMIDRICTSRGELEESYDAVFITNPTSKHYETLIDFLPLSDAFFVEKPVFVTGEEDITPFTNLSKKIYVACPLRYCNTIQWLRDNVDFKRVYSARVITSSYLPDWRPGTDYRDTYSAHKELGGGVSIDLIHEWDYITYLLGFPLTVKSIINKKSSLEIDSDDIAVYIAEYADKTVEVHLDYFGRFARRKIELITEDDVIVADLIGQKINWLKAGKTLDLSEDRDSYQQKELSHFLEILSGKTDCDNNVYEACKVLRIARGGE